MRKTLYTLNVGGNYSPEICRLTYPLLKHYADKIGAEFCVITRRAFPEWPLTVEKFQIYALAQTRGDEWSIFLDSDALVHPDMFDVTNHLPKDTVAHNGSDMAGLRWRYDRFFHRDGRHISSCNWFTIGSEWCVDLWRPLDDLSVEEALSNIIPSNHERISPPRIGAEHLIDDYIASRNIAKYGLKFTTIREISTKVNLFPDVYVHHCYTDPIEDQVVECAAPNDQGNYFERDGKTWRIGKITRLKNALRTWQIDIPEVHENDHAQWLESIAVSV